MSETPSALGPYPVERELGRGGMGVVYLGRDLRLNRPVAIKVLPDLLAKNPESLARFEREARLLASVNHPNIATIYGIEEDAGHRLLILEYIPGDTLAERLAKGALPVDEAIDIGRQIALAIEAAHEAGVIHRDLKPGNVKITPDGQVKVLDFGLAKGSEPVSNAELALSPTMTFAATGMGVILGTAGYMSPEQARGKAVDRRTDIWSFGCVLFECLAGKQIFEGETVSDTIAKILERDPNWATLPSQTPARVRDLLRRCLEKDLKKRQRDIGDVRIELEEAAAARSSSMRMATDSMTVAAPQSGSPMKMIAASALLLAIGAAAGIGAWKVFGSGASSTNAAGIMRASIAVPRSIHADSMAILPDGRTLALAGAARNADGSDEPFPRLFTRRIDDDEFKPVAGAERFLALRGSPSGERIAIVKYVSEQSTQRQLITLPLDGSAPPAKITDFSDGWRLEMAWLESGDFLIGVGDGKKYFRLPRGGGAPGPEMSFDIPESGFATFAGTLPNDRGILFIVGGYTSRGWSQDAWVLDLRTSKTHRLAESAGVIAYSPTGHIVFSRNDTLMAATFDLEQLKVTGEETPLAKGLRITDAWRYGPFSLSRQGTLVYPPGGLVGTARRLVSVDAKETVTPFGSDRRGFEQWPAVSDDGRRVAVVIANEKGNYEVWATEPDRQTLSRLLAIPSVDSDRPIWSPDGRLMAFTKTAQNKDDGVYVQNTDGTGTPRLVIARGGPDENANANSWTRDGASLIVTRSIQGKTSLWVVPVNASGPPAAARALRTTPYSDDNGKLSPDGRVLGFYSDESGKGEIYVAAYGAGGVLGHPVRVSTGGVNEIGWAGDGRRLFFKTPDAKLMSVTVDAKPTVAASVPVVAYDLMKPRVNGWTILPNGQLFAIQGAEAEYDIPSFNIVFNWFDELRARMAKGAGK